MPDALKLYIEVHAGMIPGEPMPRYTRRWTWTSADQALLEAGSTEAADKWVCMAGESREYAATLENPRLVNWVWREWVWL